MCQWRCWKQLCRLFVWFASKQAADNSRVGTSCLIHDSHSSSPQTPPPPPPPKTKTHHPLPTCLQEVIEIAKDKLPGYEDKIKMFYEEHIHEDEEIRYILDGQGARGVGCWPGGSGAIETGQIVTSRQGEHHQTIWWCSPALPFNTTTLLPHTTSTPLADTPPYFPLPPPSPPLQTKQATLMCVTWMTAGSASGVARVT